MSERQRTSTGQFVKAGAADNGNVATELTVSAVLFRATDGSTWRMRISPTGAVLLDQVDVS